MLEKNIIAIYYYTIKSKKKKIKKKYYTIKSKKKKKSKIYLEIIKKIFVLYLFQLINK